MAKPKTEPVKKITKPGESPAKKTGTHTPKTSTGTGHASGSGAGAPLLQGVNIKPKSSGKKAPKVVRPNNDVQESKSGLMSYEDVLRSVAEEHGQDIAAAYDKFIRQWVQRVTPGEAEKFAYHDRHRPPTPEELERMPHLQESIAHVKRIGRALQNWVRGGWMGDNLHTPEVSGPFDKTHPRVDLVTGRSAHPANTNLPVDEISYLVQIPGGGTMRLPKLMKIETYPGSGESGLFAMNRRGEAFDLFDPGTWSSPGSYLAPGEMGTTRLHHPYMHDVDIHDSMENDYLNTFIGYTDTHEGTPPRLLMVRLAHSGIRDQGATQEPGPSIGIFSVPNSATPEAIARQLSGVLTTTGHGRIGATSAHDSDLIIYDSSKLRPENSLRTMVTARDSGTPLVRIRGGRVREEPEHFLRNNASTMTPGGTFRPLKDSGLINELAEVGERYYQYGHVDSGLRAAELQGMYGHRTASNNSLRINDVNDMARWAFHDPGRWNGATPETLGADAFGGVKGPLSRFYGELKHYGIVNDADHFVFRRSEFSKLSEEEQLSRLTDAIKKAMFALPAVGAGAVMSTDDDTQQDAKGGESAKRKLPVFQGPPDISMFIDPRSLRSYRADAKGGREQMASFLATDDVPDTLFGIPIVSRPEQYTQEDIEFFEDHPDAGGYYDLGDEQESEEPMEEPPMEEPPMEEPPMEEPPMEEPGAQAAAGAGYSNVDEFIKWHEGDAKRKGEPVLKAYKDKNGVPAIGYGNHFIWVDGVRRAVTMQDEFKDKDAADKNYTSEKEQFQKELRKVFPDYDKWAAGSRDALFELAYNTRSQLFNSEQSPSLHRKIKEKKMTPEQAFLSEYATYRQKDDKQKARHAEADRFFLKQPRLDAIRKRLTHDGKGIKLTAGEAKGYEAYMRSVPDTVRERMIAGNRDYDTRVFWLGEGSPATWTPQPGNGHYPDYAKKPNHPTFSEESLYSTSANPGGRWEKRGGGWTFHASHVNLKVHGKKGLIKYFQEVEPESKLDFDEAAAEEFRYRR